MVPDSAQGRMVTTMALDPREAAELALLRRQCDVAAKLWGRTFSAITLSALRATDAGLMTRMWFNLIYAHQAESYVSGLKKLGIDRDPPAIAAAKYHYFSNAIGGLAMEYVEESPRKVWIRYTAPMWTYAGTALAAIPPGVRRHGTFASWHPFNGTLMGCPRLGWVLTKLMDEGEPYDEGYFIEHDHDLAPDERMRFETVAATPEFDPERAPRLDPAIWPEPRLLKARRGYSRGYVDETVSTLYGLLGAQQTHAIVGHAMRIMAVQYTRELKTDLGLDRADDDAFVDFVSGILRACDQKFVVERKGSIAAFTLQGFLPFRHPSDGLRAAYFEFFVTAARILNGRLRLARHTSGRDQSADLWLVEDTGRWQW